MLKDVAVTAVAPVAWGTTYWVATQMLPPDQPLLAGSVRMFPTGLLLLAITWRGHAGLQWNWRWFILAALNIAAYQICVFVSAYHLPGGVAATLLATAPFIGAGLAWFATGQRPTLVTWITGFAGLVGVGVISLDPAARMDLTGLLTGLGGATAIALGTLLTQRWKPGGSDLFFSAFQMAAGGAMLTILTVSLTDPWAAVRQLDARNLLGFLYLCVVGTAIAYTLWFRGVRRLDARNVLVLRLLSPFTAFVIDVFALYQPFTRQQGCGVLLILCSVGLEQIHQGRERRARHVVSGGERR